MMAPAGLQTRIPWLLFLELPPGPCCLLSPTSIQPHTPTAHSPHPTTSFHLILMVEAVPAASTVKVSHTHIPVQLVEGTRRRGKSRGWGNPGGSVLSFTYPVPSPLPTGSRSSGSTRSDGGAGRTGRPEERAPESKSGSGSESELSSRGGSLRRGGEPGGTGDGGPPPSRGSTGGTPNLRALPGLHPYGPPPGMALPYNPMMVVMMPPPPPPVSTAVQPPGAPPVRDLGSVPPELTASRQSFHMAMGNPSEFFVDVM